MDCKGLAVGHSPRIAQGDLSCLIAG